MNSYINPHTLKVEEYNEGDIQCSMCARFAPKESYRKPGQEYQSRTNCQFCYENFDEGKKLEEFVKKQKQTKTYINLEKAAEIKSNHFNYSMSVKEMIDALSKLNPNDRILINESGYYSSQPFADIFLPEKLKYTSDDINFYSIGSSTQNY